MIVLRGRWVLPITGAPLLNGWCAVEHGRIAALGRAGSSLPFRDNAPLVDLGAMAVLPALVNAHTHLELSWLRGRLPPSTAFPEWVRLMLEIRAREAPPADVVEATVRDAITEARASGTGAIGDVTNTLASVAPLRESRLRGVIFHELLRFAADGADDVLEAALLAEQRYGDAERFPVAMAAHAPYSVSPALFQGIRAVLARTPFLPSTVHLGESPEEMELLASGTGSIRTLLEDLQAWDDGWVPPRCGPVEYLDRMKLLDHRLLAVHGTQLPDAELSRLAARGCTLVTCPRSNRFVGAGEPPVGRFFAAGVSVAVGTDSLASNKDLNLFAELAELRRMAPTVPAGALLACATEGGARALRCQDDLGALEPGRAAALIAVEVPSGVTDVEEYLVQGIHPEQVHWVADLLEDYQLTIDD